MVNSFCKAGIQASVLNKDNKCLAVVLMLSFVIEILYPVFYVFWDIFGGFDSPYGININNFAFILQAGIQASDLNKDNKCLAVVLMLSIVIEIPYPGFYVFWGIFGVFL